MTGKSATSRAWLHFEDGAVFEGQIYLPKGDPRLQEGIWGEAAFTTAMSGYQETVTDPSFLGQHIIFSTSHVGHYPADEKVVQSGRCHATALIARHFEPNPFWDSVGVPLFSGLDTRSLVRYLTHHRSSHKSVITGDSQNPGQAAFAQASLHCNDLARVSQDGAKVEIAGENPIALINYGCKRAIANRLKTLGFPLVSLPFDVTAEQVRELSPRLIFLSNGPGDPREMRFQTEQVAHMLKLGIPVRGICLGHQLLGLALGGEIVRLPFGQRGINHPCFDRESGRVVITSQNHGYALEREALVKNAERPLFISHESLFDGSVEGMSSTDSFVRSVQFHPEAHPGPRDADSFFEEIKDYLGGQKRAPVVESQLFTPPPRGQKLAPREIPYKRVLLIGSGPIRIGQASEFDYSGTQACKVLREIGVEVVLLNSNPATIMTDPELSFRTYIEPITSENVKKIILKEKVDAVLSTMGGQTALNLCVELEEEGWFCENGITLLGAGAETIRKTEDRRLFAEELNSLGYTTCRRFEAKTKEEAQKLLGTCVDFPLIIRRDFALGGKGALLVHSQEEWRDVLESGLQFPIALERSLLGYKEIELEVMIDGKGDGVVICSIENVDPCGIHTGDSITVAPAQTISDRCYQTMRTIALNVAKHMGVVAGGANVQFAVNPDDEDDIVVIEMNPRVSRSSALASKATGYPIAKISALLAMGYRLEDIENDITRASKVAFEPTLDYVAVKIPIFPFDKFPTSSQILGPSMRSVGEVLALGGSFNEAFFKALRALEMGLEIPELAQLKTAPVDVNVDYLKERLLAPRQLGLLTALEALRRGISVEEICETSKITPWFVEQMEKVRLTEKEIVAEPERLFQRESFAKFKGMGLSDKYLAYLSNKGQSEIFQFRADHQLFPAYKAVDTCAGEFEARTPYFYSTYTAKQNEAHALSKENSVVILGSGPNRIGQGIEFDYSCVKACGFLKDQQTPAIMINSNPETVSTDYDSSDRLYLSPLYSEDVFDVLINEGPKGIITSFSGQTGIGIRKHIEQSFRNKFFQFRFLGSSMETINLTEDRKLFGEMTQKVDLAQTPSKEVQGHKHLLNAMLEMGMPVIIRPSYVIGGESMYIFYRHGDIDSLPSVLKHQLQKSTTTFRVERYLEGALEYDVDLVRDRLGHTIFCICEHIEYAGVHSGDSGMVAPPTLLSKQCLQKIKHISQKLCELLGVVGPVNFQYAVKDEQVYCIEANPRGSRTLPFLSKAYNISLPQLATSAMLGGEIPNWSHGASEVPPFFAVKQSTFPFDRFLQDNIILGPKMRSTGETMGLDGDRERAVMKSYLGNYPHLDKVGSILFSLADKHKALLLPYLSALAKLDYQFMATPGTCRYIRQQGLDCQQVDKIGEASHRSIVAALGEKNLRVVFNTPQNTGTSKSDGEFIRNRAIQLGIPCFTRRENICAVIEAMLTTVGAESVVHPCSLQDIHQQQGGLV